MTANGYLETSKQLVKFRLAIEKLECVKNRTVLQNAVLEGMRSVVIDLLANQKKYEDEHLSGLFFG